MYERIKKKHTACRIERRSIEPILSGKGVRFLQGAAGMKTKMKLKIATDLLMTAALDQFVFFDYEEPAAFFLLDYMAGGALFICVGHYLGQLVRRKKR